MQVQSLIDSINEDVVIEPTIHDLIQASLIPQGIEVPKPDIVFGINDISILTKKSISTLIGRAKSGKTTVTSWIVSKSILDDINVLWIDTEQGLYYGSRTQHWILSMSNLTQSECLQFYDLKTFTPSKRVSMIEEIIKMFKPDLVVVDGIRDLVFDINNPEQATIIVGDLMRWADHYDCHILNILHQNKGNEHARGHLGTEMINKSESVIKVEADEDKLIVCTPEYTRSKAFDAIAFDRDSSGMPFLVEGYAGKIKTSSKNSKRGIDPTDINLNSTHETVVNAVFSKQEHLTKEEVNNNIMHYFKSQGVDVGRNKAIEFVTHYLQIGIIWKNPYIKGFAKFGKNPKFDPMTLINYDPSLLAKINAGQTINTIQDDGPDVF